LHPKIYDLRKMNWKINSSGLVLLLFSCTALPIHQAPKEAHLFESRALTPPDLFTNNIEGPGVFHDSLFVVNFGQDGTIAYVDTSGHCKLYLTLPQGSTGNAIRFDRDGNMYIADFTGHNVLFVNRKKEVSVFCHDTRFNQPNDLCLSRNYGYILASDPKWSDSTGKLWRIDLDGKASLLSDKMGTTNGICLSPDEKTLYVNESVQRNIWSYDIDTMGNVANKRLFVSFKDYGLDGMHCDKKGNLYVDRYGKGVIAIFSPEGELLREVPLTGKSCSNLTFGGKDGKTVYVTLQDKKALDVFRSDTPGLGW
jgi:gluconolactonase